MDDEDEKVDETRRNLIRAGWIIPAVIAVQLPVANTAFASPLHVDGGAHLDAGVHGDVGVHTDSACPLC
jgi:hypothetical protein